MVTTITNRKSSLSVLITLSDLERRDGYFRRIFLITLESFDIEQPNLAEKLTHMAERGQPRPQLQGARTASPNFKDFLHAKVKVHTLDTAPLRSESPPQKRSGMARVLKGFHSFTCTPTRSSAIGMSHTCLCLSSRSWYSFTDPGGIEG